MHSNQVQKSKYSLVLASKSPRRKELLGWMKIPFEIVVQDTDEISSFSRVDEVVVDVAKQKGHAVLKELSKRDDFLKSYFPLIVSSDTIVTLGDTIYGKPKNADDARRMLLELSDKTHKVLTAVHIIAHDLKTNKLKEHSFYCMTDVTFENISKDLLDVYIGTNESLDKAGSYGIQGPSLTFISNVNGSYSNVVGFPLSDFINHLKEFLGYTDDCHGAWRSLFKGV